MSQDDKVRSVPVDVDDEYFPFRTTGPHTKAYKLLGILQEYAPTSSAQQMCANWYNQTIIDGASEKELELALVSHIFDGLKFGNWPWITLNK